MDPHAADPPRGIGAERDTGIAAPPQQAPDGATVFRRGRRVPLRALRALDRVLLRRSRGVARSRSAAASAEDRPSRERPSVSGSNRRLVDVVAAPLLAYHDLFARG